MTKNILCFVEYSEQIIQSDVKYCAMFCFITEPMKKLCNNCCNSVWRSLYKVFNVIWDFAATIPDHGF